MERIQTDAGPTAQFTASHSPVHNATCSEPSASVQPWKLLRKSNNRPISHCHVSKVERKRPRALCKYRSPGAHSLENEKLAHECTFAHDHVFFLDTHAW